MSVYRKEYEKYEVLDELDMTMDGCNVCDT